MKEAIIVVDMLNDFVTGALTCDRALAIVPHVKKLLDGARENNIPVIFCNDCHLPEIDGEFKIWGPHAVKGTKGAMVIPELDVNEKIDFEEVVEVSTVVVYDATGLIEDLIYGEGFISKDYLSFYTGNPYLLLGVPPVAGPYNIDNLPSDFITSPFKEIIKM